MTLDEMIATMSDADRSKLAQAALGRLFRIGSRPYQPGDDETYDDCRAVLMSLSRAGYC